MRVVAINAGSEMSGAENVLLDVVDHAAREGHEVTVLCPPGPLAERVAGHHAHAVLPAVSPAHREGSGGLVGRSLSRAAALASAQFRVAAAIRRSARDADLLLVNSTLALPALRLATPPRLARRRGPRVAWLVHDTLVHRKQRAAARLGGSAVDVAVAVSEPTARAVGSAVRHVVVRTNGVDIPTSPRTGPAPGATPVVGVLAVITPWKGQDVALEALARTEGVDLEIAGRPFPGDEGFLAGLHRRTEELGLSGRVRFLGVVDKAEVLDRWSALLSPSVSPEAGPLGVLEAMAVGLPVIATDHGGSSDYLREGRGLLVPPRDAAALAEAIGEIVSDGERRRQLGERAREAARSEYDKSQTIVQMWEGIASG